MKAATTGSCAVLLLCACTSVPLRERSLYVAEGEHHVAAWLGPEDSSLSESDRIAALTADIRAAHGNIAVYVLREPHNTNSVVIFTIWESHEDLAAWRQPSTDSASEYDVLLESTK